MLTEYSMEWRYAARTRSRERDTTSGDSPASGMPVYTLPLPSVFQSSRCGSGAHGAWLDSSTISAISGSWGSVRSLRWNDDRVNWSGIEAKLNSGPRYPRLRTV